MSGETPLRIGAAYIRVSTDDQMEYSPESQLDEIMAYAKRNNILLSNEYIFREDEGISGKRAEKRIEFQRMIATAKLKPKPFDVILVWKFSRFARNQDESTFYKSILRKKLDIDVVSVSEPVLDGMYGRLIEMIIEWQDEFYLYNLSQEVRRGMKKRAELGLYNSKMPLGYRKEIGSDKVPYIYEPEADIVRMIFSLFESGHDKNYIVRLLNDKGFKTKTGRCFDNECVSYILENPFYIGKVRWNRRKDSSSRAINPKDEWIISDAPHTPLITKETFDFCQKRIQQMLETHSKYSHPVSHTKHWLSGIVKCSVCGKSLSWKKAQKNTGNSFQCLGYRMGIHNESQSISEKKLTAAVLESLHRVLELNAPVEFEILKTPDVDSIELEMLKQELSAIPAKEVRIKEAYMNGVDTISEYQQNKELLQHRRVDLSSRIEFLSKKEDPIHYQELFLSTVRDAIGIIESDSDYETKANALRSIVKKIIFYKDTKTLEFHYYMQV